VANGCLIIALAILIALSVFVAQYRFPFQTSPPHTGENRAGAAPNEQTGTAQKSQSFNISPTPPLPVRLRRLARRGIASLSGAATFRWERKPNRTSPDTGELVDQI
jgi:hypothetical protein